LRFNKHSLSCFPQSWQNTQKYIIQSSREF
jgi:hypothetical protein